MEEQNEIVNEVIETEAIDVEYVSPMMEVDTEEEGETIALTEVYGDVNKTVVYVDPVTGEQLDPDNLGPFEKIKFIANQLGQTIDSPEKNCKHCHGRGYTSVDAKTQLPVACSCIYKTYRKTNPSWQNEVRPLPNRKMKRQHQKQMGKLINKMRPAYEKAEAIKDASRAGLGKNTPGYIAKEYRDDYEGVNNVTIDLEEETETPQIETAKGVIGKES